METHLLGFFEVKEEVAADPQWKSTGRQQFPDDDVTAATALRKLCEWRGHLSTLHQRSSSGIYFLRFYVGEGVKKYNSNP